MKKTKAVVGMVESLMDLVDALNLPVERRETITVHLNEVCLELDKSLSETATRRALEDEIDGRDLLAQYLRMQQREAE